jgi:tetrahydrodipicolinate N-succinyltransferase
MESKQAEHKTMTEEQIKEAVCELVCDLQELKETFIERNQMILEDIETLDSKLYWLKRHFCPEKFVEMKVPMSTLSEMMEKAYFQNAGETQRLFNQEESNDSTT